MNQNVELPGFFFEPRGKVVDRPHVGKIQREPFGVALFEFAGNLGRSEVSEKDAGALFDGFPDKSLSETACAACDKKGFIFEKGFQD